MLGLGSWLKRYVKPRMHPIPQDRARRVVDRLSMIYGFLGWNFVTVCVYLIWKERIPDGPNKIEKYAEILDIDHASVIEFSGFNKIAEYEMDRREEVRKDTKRKRKATDLDPKESFPEKESQIPKDSFLSWFF